MKQYELIPKTEDFYIVKKLSPVGKEIGKYFVDKAAKTCTCDGFHFRKKCSHLKMVRGLEMMQSESKLLMKTSIVFVITFFGTWYFQYLAFKGYQIVNVSIVYSGFFFLLWNSDERTKVQEKLNLFEGLE